MERLAQVIGDAGILALNGEEAAGFETLNEGLNRALFGIISSWPGGKGFREHIVDPIIFHGDQVTWRNYEASYDVAELEPGSRDRSTYVLQEYFVPVERFDEFVPKLGAVMPSEL